MQARGLAGWFACAAAAAAAGGGGHTQHSTAAQRSAPALCNVCGVTNPACPVHTAELSQKRQAEQDESFAAVRRAMLGTKHAAKHTNKQQGAAGSPKSSEGELVEHVDGDVAHQVSHSATSNLRRRRGRGKQAKAKQGQSTSNHNSSDDVAAADGAIAKPQDAQESGAETDEEDMNLDMTEDQRAMQKALLGTRDTRKIASMLDEAEQKVRSGTPLKSHRSMSRSFDCIVYVAVL